MSVDVKARKAAILKEVDARLEREAEEGYRKQYKVTIRPDEPAKRIRIDMGTGHATYSFENPVDGVKKDFIFVPLAEWDALLARVSALEGKKK